MLRALLCLFILIPSAAFASRPVAYLDAWSVMSENRPEENEWMANYTLQPHLALGVHGSRLDLGGGAVRTFVGPTLAVLAHRYVANDLQANLYATGGYGSQNQWLSVEQIDVETRKYYGEFRQQNWGQFGDGGLPTLSTWRVRAGIAPYLAEFESMHTWFVLQAEGWSWEGPVQVTPMLRFFYRNVLWEMGVSVRGEVNFALDIEF